MPEGMTVDSGERPRIPHDSGTRKRAPHNRRVRCGRLGAPFTPSPSSLWKERLDDHYDHGVVLVDDAMQTPAAIAGFLAGYYCDRTRRNYARSRLPGERSCLSLDVAEGGPQLAPCAGAYVATLEKGSSPADEATVD
jgi:hypothetical protein